MTFSLPECPKLVFYIPIVEVYSIALDQQLCEKSFLDLLSSLWKYFELKSLL